MIAHLLLKRPSLTLKAGTSLAGILQIPIISKHDLSYLIFFGFMSSSKNSPFKGARSSDSLFGGHIKAPWGLLSFGNSQISNISWSFTSFHPSFGSLKRWVFGLGKEKYIFTFCIWHSYLLSEGFGILPKTQLSDLKTFLPLTPFFG